MRHPNNRVLRNIFMIDELAMPTHSRTRNSNERPPPRKRKFSDVAPETFILAFFSLYSSILLNCTYIRGTGIYIFLCFSFSVRVRGSRYLFSTNTDFLLLISGTTARRVFLYCKFLSFDYIRFHIPIGTVTLCTPE